MTIIYYQLKHFLCFRVNTILWQFSKWLITRISNLKSRDTKKFKKKIPANQKSRRPITIRCFACSRWETYRIQWTCRPRFTLAFRPEGAPKAPKTRGALEICEIALTLSFGRQNQGVFRIFSPQRCCPPSDRWTTLLWVLWQAGTGIAVEIRGFGASCRHMRLWRCGKNTVRTGTRPRVYKRVVGH